MKFRVSFWLCVLGMVLSFSCRGDRPIAPANTSLTTNLLMGAPSVRTAPRSLATTAEASAHPEQSPNPPGNLLKNPGFEDGREGWFYMDWSKNWVDFDIASNRAHSGEKSAYLRLDAGPEVTGAQVHGVVQTLTPNRFPEKASGWYRVENWKRGSPKQYLQFVVMVWGGHPQFNNYQVRYILAGLTEPPYRMMNVKYLFAPDVPSEPPRNKWVHFDFPILEDFKKEWGMVPKGYEKINFFYEARFDTQPAEGQRVRADVYFDDLYVGN